MGQVTCWRGAGLSQEASVVQEAGNDDVISWESYRKPNRISMNKAKHNQTMATGSTAPDTTPSAPLPHSDTLVTIQKTAQQQLINLITYENIKREKN